MDRMTFVTKIVEFVEKIVAAAAWPVVIFLIAGRFEPEIKRLLGRVTEAEIAGQKFKMALAHAEATEGKLPPVIGQVALQLESATVAASGTVSNAETTTANTPTAPADVPVELPQPDPLADSVNPAGSVMELWQLVLVALREKLIAIGRARRSPMPFGRVVGLRDESLLDALSQNGFPNEHMLFLHELKNARDAAALGGAMSISANEVARYRSLAQLAIQSLVAFQPADLVGHQPG
ncbi:hypothetical protein [Ralstonia sp.]|uniref:hypothetical protein n=1 Tax=Ralstonia sp. TaxID=54061 RepID=UPI0031D90116